MLCQFLLAQGYSKVNQLYQVYISGIHIYLLFRISLQLRLPQSFEQSCLCYTVGSHQLSTLYIVSIVYVGIPIFQFIHPPLFPLSVHSFILYIYVSISADKFICFKFLDYTYKLYYIGFVFLLLTYFPLTTVSRSIHVSVNGTISFLSKAG